MSAFAGETAAVVLEPSSPRPLDEISLVLADFFEIRIVDAAIRFRRSGGIILWEAPAEMARRLVERLGEVGVAARSVEPSLLRDLPRGFRARSLEILPEAIQAHLTAGRPLPIPREDIRGIHLSALYDRDQRGEPESSAALGEPTLLSPRTARLREALLGKDRRMPRLTFTVFWRDDAEPLRIPKDDLDYSSLGSRKLPHSLDNFLLLLDGVLALAGRAWMADRIRAFLERPEPPEFLYFRPEEVQNFERWMQLWIRLKEAPGELSSPPSIL